MTSPNFTTKDQGLCKLQTAASSSSSSSSTSFYTTGCDASSLFLNVKLHHRMRLQRQLFLLSNLIPHHRIRPNIPNRTYTTMTPALYKQARLWGSSHLSWIRLQIILIQTHRPSSILKHQNQRDQRRHRYRLQRSTVRLAARQVGRQNIPILQRNRR